MDFYKLPIRHVRKDTRDAVVVEFAVPAHLRDSFAYTQGQYLTLRTRIEGEEHRRSYSICASPRLRVAIKRVEDGIFSSWAHGALREGDELEVASPQGRFFVPLDPKAVRSYLAVAAGSGITPVLSLIETTLELEPKSRFTLVYGNRSASSTMFREELQHLKDRSPAASGKKSMPSTGGSIVNACWHCAPDGSTSKRRITSSFADLSQ
jgi:ring-1,2-phenylacetyl-CoA epoxidase subunit PaaE